MTEKILYKELSYQIVGCFYKAYNSLGPGHKEEIYHRSLAIEFDKQGIAFDSKRRLKIKYEGKEVGSYEPDFIIEDKVIVEIKSVILIPKVFEKQLFYYLKASGYQLGYLVNFGADEIDIRRRVN